MAVEGRPPKPTALKLLHGDDKHDPKRINRREPRATFVTAPPPMSDAARAWWDRLAPDMERTGVLREWDAPALAECLEALVLVRAARANMVKEMTGQWTFIPNVPAPSTVYNRTVKTFLDLAGRFGMTPSDRTRLTTPQETSSDKADLLSG